MTGAKILSGDHELFGQTDVELKNGEELKVGTTRCILLPTPGHTPECVTCAVYLKDAGEKCWASFTGDALFVGDTGRIDLPDPAKTGENAGILYDSVHGQIGPLSDQTLLCPAHASGSACGGHISDRDDSAVGIEKASNPVFTKGRAEFVAHKRAEKMARPPYFRHLETVNLLGGRPLPWPATPRVLQPKEFQQQMKHGLVFDTRLPEAFAGGHIPISYNIWLEGLSTFGGWVARENARIFLVVDSLEVIHEAVKSLARIGIGGVEGVLTKGVQAWREQGLPFDSAATTSVQECANWLQAERVQVLDVRDEYEWKEKRIPGAHHQFMGYLEKGVPKVPKNSKIVVHCSVGHRSGLAAVSILKRHGFTRLYNMLGGITACETLGFPLEKTNEAQRTRHTDDLSYGPIVARPRRHTPVITPMPLAGLKTSIGHVWGS